MVKLEEEENMEVDDGEEVEEINDEDLEMDESVYRLNYCFTTENSCLSFDILTDCLGDKRSVERGGDPITAYLVAGAQTSTQFSDIYVLKLDNMKPLEEIKEKPDCDDEESSDSDKDLDDLPELECLKIKSKGNINRIRSNIIRNQYFAASMNDNKSLTVYNISKHVAALNDSGKMSDFVKNPEATSPIFSSQLNHEGYAIDWNPLAENLIATGDGSGIVEIWSPNETTWIKTGVFPALHSASVEDIQWSPSEPTVFISVSVDKTICVSDIRAKNKKAMICVQEAHLNDINVCSWSKFETKKLVTGSDDCSIRVWDLRLIQQQASAAPIPGVERYTHLFDYHKKPITSVEWSKHESGVFVATSEDNVTTIWDIDLEADAGEMKDEEENQADVPVQLLFTHGGQQEIKEAHWHSQIPGLIISTAKLGFNVFRTINV